MSPKIIFFRSVRPENLHVDSPGVVLQGRLGISPTVITFGRQRTTFLIRARRKIKKVVLCRPRVMQVGGLAARAWRTTPELSLQRFSARREQKKWIFGLTPFRPAAGRTTFFFRARARVNIYGTRRGGAELGWVGGPRHHHPELQLHYNCFLQP